MVSKIRFLSVIFLFFIKEVIHPFVLTYYLIMIVWMIWIIRGDGCWLYNLNNVNFISFIKPKRGAVLRYFNDAEWERLRSVFFFAESLSWFFIVSACSITSFIERLIYLFFCSKVPPSLNGINFWLFSVPTFNTKKLF